MAHRHGTGWRGAVRVPGQPPLRLGGFATKAAAERWERTTRTDLERGTWRDPRTVQPTFEQWCKQWLATRGTLKRSASSAEETIVRVHLIPAFGPIKVDEVDALLVRQFTSDLSGRRAAKTVRNIHAVLFNVLQLAVDTGRRDANPCVGTRLPKNRRAKPRAFLTEPEIERLIAATSEPWRPLVTLLATTGLRWGEAVGLRVKYVDLLDRSLWVRETINETGGVIEDETPKSDASVRRVSLPARAVDALLPLVAGKAGDEFVFTTATGLPVRHRNFYYRQWGKAVTTAGLAERKPTPHDLRHSHAAILIARGVPLSAIKERLGHDSIDTTDRLYGFLLPQVDRGVLAALDDAFSPAEPASPLPADVP